MTDVNDRPDDLFSATTEKQRRILEAAVEVFAERGFAGSPTAEIAKRAGVAEGTIFKHYKTKKDLLIGVVGPLFFRLVLPKQLEPLQAIFRHPHASVEALLTSLYRERVAYLHSHARLVRIFAQEVSYHPELRTLAEQTLGQMLLPDAVTAIERFQALGMIVQAPPTSVLRIIFGTMAAYALTRFVLFPEQPWDDSDEVAFMIQVVTRGLTPPTAA